MLPNKPSVTTDPWQHPHFWVTWQLLMGRAIKIFSPPFKDEYSQDENEAVARRGGRWA